MPGLNHLSVTASNNFVVVLMLLSLLPLQQPFGLSFHKFSRMIWSKSNRHNQPSFASSKIFNKISSTALKSFETSIINDDNNDNDTPTGTRIAIVGGGYSGLACGFYLRNLLLKDSNSQRSSHVHKIHHDITVFGLERFPGDSVGVSCASSISVRELWDTIM